MKQNDIKEKIENKRMKKLQQGKNNQRYLIWKIILGQNRAQSKLHDRDKDRHFTLRKRLSHQENSIILNNLASNK